MNKYLEICFTTKYWKYENNKNENNKNSVNKQKIEKTKEQY